MRTPGEGLALLAGVAGAVAYPVLIYLSIDRLPPRALAGALVVLVAARLAWTALRGGGKRFPFRALLPFLLAGLCSAAILFAVDDAAVLLYLPALVNLVLAGAFLHSRLHPPTVIEHFAAADYPELPPSVSRYCRGVTVLWIGIFLVNAAACALAARYAPRGWWLAWTSAGMYLFMFACFGLEYLVRRSRRPGFDREAAAMGAGKASP